MNSANMELVPNSHNSYSTTVDFSEWVLGTWINSPPHCNGPFCRHRFETGEHFFRCSVGNAIGDPPTKMTFELCIPCYGQFRGNISP